MISFVIPTRNRPIELGLTLDALARQPPAHMGTGAGVIVVDNASDPPARAPARLANGLPVTLVRAAGNLGASARNIAAAAARNPWLVMLDDDSAPTDAPFAAVLSALAADVAAVGGQITLPSGRREAGGLPEVVVGCGCVVRRDAFLAAGGYDGSFGYYVEEYDLCAKLIGAGHRVVHTARLRFEHRKVEAGRSFASILYRLVRNNGWTIARYAPDDRRDEALATMLSRYRAIAGREDVGDAFERAASELDRTLDAQPRHALSESHWDRFTGAHAVRSSLVPALLGAGVDAVRMIDPGKGVETIRDVIQASGILVTCDAPTAVVGTLSPGPMADAAARRGGRALRSWEIDFGREVARATRRRAGRAVRARPHAETGLSSGMRPGAS